MSRQTWKEITGKESQHTREGNWKLYFPRGRWHPERSGAAAAAGLCVPALKVSRKTPRAAGRLQGLRADSKDSVHLSAPGSSRRQDGSGQEREPWPRAPRLAPRLRRPDPRSAEGRNRARPGPAAPAALPRSDRGGTAPSAHGARRGAGGAERSPGARSGDGGEEAEEEAEEEEEEESAARRAELCAPRVPR